LGWRKQRTFSIPVHLLRASRPGRCGIARQSKATFRSWVAYNDHAVRWDKSAHQLQRLVKQTRNREEGDDCGKEDEGRKEGHHRVIRERRCHLQRVIAFNIRVCPQQGRLDSLQLHTLWMRFIGMAALSKLAFLSHRSRGVHFYCFSPLTLPPGMVALQVWPFHSPSRRPDDSGRLRDFPALKGLPGRPFSAPTTVQFSH
jgi:hypothetical protein